MEKQKLQVITDEDLKILINKERCCLVINDLIYDVTDFQEHPGGFSVLEELNGTDATKAFDDIGHSSEAKKLMKNYLIGVKKNSNKYKTNIQSKTKEDGKEFVLVEEEKIEEEKMDISDDEKIQPKNTEGTSENNYYVLAAIIVVFSTAYYFIFLKK